MPVNVALIVAHPDDETIWAGGTVLGHPHWNCFVAALCRAGDKDRAPRFFEALRELGASGAMGDLDDGPEQTPLKDSLIKETVLSLLPSVPYDLVMTHGPEGEYTRHLRHEEASRSVMELWTAGKIRSPSLWTFAYEDGGGAYPPRPAKPADHVECLGQSVYDRKYSILTGVYGFSDDSFEVRAASREEAFRCHDSPQGMRDRESREK